VGVIEVEQIAGLPATRLYLSEPWQDFLAAIRSEPLLPTLKAMPASEERVWTAGQAAIFEIWRRLGWTILTHPNRGWGLLVDAPMRVEDVSD
jgi:hypothetical protein